MAVQLVGIGLRAVAASPIAVKVGFTFIGIGAVLGLSNRGLDVLSATDEFLKRVVEGLGGKFATRSEEISRVLDEIIAELKGKL